MPTCRDANLLFTDQKRTQRHRWQTVVLGSILSMTPILGLAAQDAGTPQAPKPSQTSLPPTAKPAAKPTSKPVQRNAQGLPVQPPGTSGDTAQPGEAPNAGVADQAGAEATTSTPLKITLTPSETPLKIGSTSNIAATIQNISSKPVRVELNTLQLTTHSIVASSTSLCVMAMTPNYNVYMNPEVVLQPQDQVSVLFNLSQGGRFGASTEELEEDSGTVPDKGTVQSKVSPKVIEAIRQSCNAGFWGPVKRALDFSPGNYAYFLSGYFSLCIQPTDASCRLPMRAISLSATFPVGIDQTSIIIFAIVGGMLALLVVTFNDANKKGSTIHQFSSVPATKRGILSVWERLTSSEGIGVGIKFIIRAFGVAILSAAFTIVTSRLSDTQLPVKITILDAWGAMTIGFVSFFVGQKFIGALTNWGGSSRKSDSSH